MSLLHLNTLTYSLSFSLSHGNMFKLELFVFRPSVAHGNERERGRKFLIEGREINLHEMS